MPQDNCPWAAWPDEEPGTSQIPPSGSLARPQRDVTDHSSPNPDFTSGRNVSGGVGTASNVKSRVNRLSVPGAIRPAHQRLQLYSPVPPNGLVVCAMTVTEERKEKKVHMDFEHLKPISTSLYLCDNKFHPEVLTARLSGDGKFGFVVIDGLGVLGALCGNMRKSARSHWISQRNIVEEVSQPCIFSVQERKSDVTMF